MGTKPTDRSVYPDGTPTCSVVIVRSNKNDDVTFHVHDTSCGDRRRYPNDADGDWDYDYEVRDLREVVDATYGPDCGSFYVESGWEGMADDSVSAEERNETAWTEYKSDFKVFPCVDLPDDIGGVRWATRTCANCDKPLSSGFDYCETCRSLTGLDYKPENRSDAEAVEAVAEEPDAREGLLAVKPSPWIGHVDIFKGEQWISVHRTDIPGLIQALANSLLKG